MTMSVFGEAPINILGRIIEVNASRNVTYALVLSHRVLAMATRQVVI